MSDMIPEPTQRRNIPQQEKSPLILPDILPEPQFGESPPVLDLVDTGAGDKGVGDGTTDPLIQGLIDRLPKPDSTWSLDDRVKWLRTAANIFVLIYKAGDGEDREIRLVLAKDETADRTV
jgi:hypothetical protein